MMRSFLEGKVYPYSNHKRRRLAKALSICQHGLPLQVTYTSTNSQCDVSFWSLISFNTCLIASRSWEFQVESEQIRTSQVHGHLIEFNLRIIANEKL
jgi:hypothetical protein